MNSPKKLDSMVYTSSIYDSNPLIYDSNPLIYDSNPLVYGSSSLTTSATTSDSVLYSSTLNESSLSHMVI